MTETIRIAAGNGAEVTLNRAETEKACAVYVDARGIAGGEILYTPPQPESDEFMAIENHSPYWCRPYFGQDLRD